MQERRFLMLSIALLFLAFAVFGAILIGVTRLSSSKPGRFAAKRKRSTPASTPQPPQTRQTRQTHREAGGKIAPIARRLASNTRLDVPKPWGW
jgi:hypothetical protein